MHSQSEFLLPPPWQTLSMPPYGFIRYHVHTGFHQLASVYFNTCKLQCIYNYICLYEQAYMERSYMCTRKASFRHACDDVPISLESQMSLYTMTKDLFPVQNLKCLLWSQLEIAFLRTALSGQSSSFSVFDSIDSPALLQHSLIIFLQAILLCSYCPPLLYCLAKPQYTVTSRESTFFSMQGRGSLFMSCDCDFQSHLTAENNRNFFANKNPYPGLLTL